MEVALRFTNSVLLVLAMVFQIVASQKVINTLPGFPGELPFKLETGYVGVGDLEDVQLFYYFIESERSPEDDPLVLWLTGGPGCSAFSGLIFENLGPLSFDYGNSRTRLPVPALKLNPYSWTKVANIIFLDSPVGTGFSYAQTSQGYNTSDTLAVADIYSFLRKWLMAHPNFQTNELYVAGDSYSGIIIPIVVWEISNGNELGHKPAINLQGYVIGNPATNISRDENFRVPFAHLKALISDELYESTKTNCNGEYIIVDPDNALCLNDLKRVSECTSKIYEGQILEPSCDVNSAPKTAPSTSWGPSFFTDDSIDILLLSTSPSPQLWCRSYNYLYSYIWANDKTVQNTLGVREGTIKEWLRCNKSLAYTYVVASSLIYHQKLIRKGYRVLIYSGDHDMVIPYLATCTWIESLNLTIEEDWRPWFVDGQVAGYQILYTYKKYMLTFATIKGGGHTAPEYKPEECFAMIYRWFAYYSL